jgi:hypothetical protein
VPSLSSILSFNTASQHVCHASVRKRSRRWPWQPAPQRSCGCETPGEVRRLRIHESFSSSSSVVQLRGACKARRGSR